MQSSGWVSRLAWSTAVAKAEEGSTCACGRSGGGGASGPNRESEPAIIAGGSGGGGSAGVGSEAGGAAAVGGAVGGVSACAAADGAADAGVAAMALLTASTRTHSAASSWQMATSTSSMPVQACRDRDTQVKWGLHAVRFISHFDKILLQGCSSGRRPSFC